MLDLTKSGKVKVAYSLSLAVLEVQFAKKE